MKKEWESKNYDIKFKSSNEKIKRINKPMNFHLFSHRLFQFVDLAFSFSRFLGIFSEFPQGPKTRLSAQPFMWRRLFILMQIKLIFTRKVVHWASFWFSELEGEVLITLYFKFN